MAVKLSFTSKMNGVPSWSLQAVDTCPGAKTKGGALVEACKGCYARQGHYAMPNVQNTRAFNKKDWQRDTWIDDMVSAIRDYRYFRWFDSGDVYCVELARKILEVVKRTPWCNHWLPTRSYKFPKIKAMLEEINAQPNACVRYSSDRISSYDKEHGSVITRHGLLPGTTLCKANPTCGDCRACWDKSVKVIAYPAKGTAFKKLRREAAPMPIQVRLDNGTKAA